MFRYLLEGLAVTAAVAVYFLPAIVADRKGRRNVLLLALLNALFGWTVVCWIAALYWALHPDSQGRIVRTVRATRRAQAHSTVAAIVDRAQKRADAGRMR
ncbi:Superinfection immunity protein (plasmid) [Caballeronia sp. SBC1]|uniref:superinfection immunity protein n=1 Tax=unclassified Caballeronia TaxID=2646786 RepID=UPI0013E10F86|nr:MULTISPECIES: superinfection immunity protein [unclassified Caballeronia]QIE28119.1 Superinfection immunity protein [Caballeronia sp. SBC2]QIN66181.1 Superinfection immunity protein [Caballeronia sp. SBC1]